MRHFLLRKVAALLAVAAFVAATATAQTPGPGGGGGYGPGAGRGYGNGYGMTGGRGPGMMGGGYGQGYGPRGGSFATRSFELTLAQAMRMLEPSNLRPRVDRAHTTVTFTGSHVVLSMAAVQPSYPDTTFEISGLVDPTIVIPSGSTVTLSLVNMDYGANMNHGVEITPVAPPYPVLGMMGGMPDAVAVLPILPPRSAQELQSSRFAATTTTFRAPPPGVYYYICQYYDHASKGMYGKLIVSGS